MADETIPGPALVPTDWDDDADPPSSPTILVVDDDPGQRRLLRARLERAGMGVAEAGDGQVAMKALTEQRVDLVLLDVQMPGESGVEVCRRIRATWDAIELPVVMVTSMTDRDTRVWGRAVGANEFLVKPVDEAELLIRLGNLLKLKRLHEQLADLGNRGVAQATRREEAAQIAQREAEQRAARIEEDLTGIGRRLGQAVTARILDGGRELLLSRIAALTATELGVPQDEAARYPKAFLLRDVGMAAAPTRWQPDQGASDEARGALHPGIGHWILGAAKTPWIHLAATIALSHHERWDEGGYPDGRAGEEIPLPGRIAAVLDGLLVREDPDDGDTLLEALERVRAGASTRFDPEVVAAVGAVIERRPALQRAWTEGDPKAPWGE